MRKQGEPRVVHDVMAARSPSIHSLHFDSAFLSPSLVDSISRLSTYSSRSELVTSHRARVHGNVDRLAERVFLCKTSGKGLSFSFFSDLAQTRAEISLSLHSTRVFVLAFDTARFKTV